MTAFTEAGTYDATVTEIADGDDVNAAITNAPLQALVNRTKYLKDLLDAGIKKAQVFADAAALRAATTHASGSVAAIANGTFFVYNAASTATDDGVLVIKPTDVGGGAGRWLNPAYILLGQANTWTATQTFAGIYATSLATTGGGNIVCDGDLVSVGYCAVGTTLAVGGASVLTGLVTCSAGLVVNGAAGIDCNGPLDVSGACALHGAVRCYSTLQVDGAATFNGLATLTGGAAIDGNSTLTQPLVCTVGGLGRVRKRVIAGANADTTYGIADADEVIITSLSADRAYALSSTGAGTGDHIRFINTQTASQVTITPPVGIPFVIKNATTYYRALDCTFMAGVWYLVPIPYDA